MSACHLGASSHLERENQTCSKALQIDRQTMGFSVVEILNYKQTYDNYDTGLVEKKNYKQLRLCRVFLCPNVWGKPPLVSLLMFLIQKSRWRQDFNGKHG